VRDDADDQRFARLAIEEFGPAPQKQTEQGGDNGSFPAEERFVCSSGADAASGESKLVCKSLIGANGRS
jgi:hypothetical protein